MDPLDPNTIDILLTMLKEHAGDRAFQFKCGMFSVAFDGAPMEDDEEQVSTDVRGFQAPSEDEDDYEDEDDPVSRMSRHHRSALRSPVPLLNPGKKS